MQMRKILTLETSTSFLINWKFDLKDFNGRLCLILEISMVVPLANLTLEIPVVILHCIGLILNLEVMMMSSNRFECSITRATLICLS